MSFIGAGRVAGILCRAFSHAGFTIDMIVTEKGSSGRTLADSCSAVWSDKPVFPDSTEVIIVAVPDNRLKTVLGEIKCSNKTVVAHTAGSVGLDVFPDSLERRGVFYPLQTFSHDRKISFGELPVFIEASDSISLAVLSEITGLLGARRYVADTEHRRMLHLSAVFVCNFVNHMLTHGKDLALKAGFSFEELKPLINETFMKALENGPENSQTGPAIRNDINTIEKHLELLSFDPDLQRIYRELSGSIINYHNKS
jgi:predicted short-subunit dehydrogenase-like oxidoreductase (DUF2520 family)